VEGKGKLRLNFEGEKSALPYSIIATYRTEQAQNSPNCEVELHTKLSSTSTFVGETIRFTAELENKINKNQAMTVAILALPAGLSAQPWQLKELQEKKVFDYYETNKNQVIIYYKNMHQTMKRK